MQTDGHDRSTDVAESLRSAIGRFIRATKAHADSMPPSRLETLGHLNRSGPQTMVELAEARGVSHQSVSRMIADLEQLGLVVKKSHPTDARGFLVTLSPEGRSVLGAEHLARADIIAVAIDATLSKRDQQLLARVPAILDRLSDGMSA
ncbi:MAG: MarR family transcriptional regulator [Aeromicrobium sp.]